jgi:hypothetical protein
MPNEMDDQKGQPLEIGDSVRIIEGTDGEIWKVVGSRSTEPHWQIQRDKDTATVLWKKTSELEFVAKPTMQESDSAGFVPARRIMD